MTVTAFEVKSRPVAPSAATLTAVALGGASGYVIPNGPPGIGLVALGWVAAAVLWRIAPTPVRGGPC